MSNFDSKAKRANYLSALKTLDAAPKEIAAAQQQYKTDLQSIRTMEDSGNFAPTYIKRMKDSAQEKLDTATRKGVDKMRSALDTVRAEQNSRERLDINSAKIQNVLTVVNTFGKSLDYNAQVDIIEGFRGDPAGLKFVSDLFKKQNYATADYAASLTKGPSKQAIDNVAYCIAKYDGLGAWDDSKLYWTKNEFAQAHDRLVTDPGADPYVDALKALKHENRDNQYAQQRIAEGLAQALDNDGGEVDTAEILNAVLADLEANE